MGTWSGFAFFASAVGLWLVVATITMGGFSILAFIFALMLLLFGLPIIIFVALSEFGFSRVQAKWRAMGYLLFIVSCLAIFAYVVGSLYTPGTENFTMLVYPAVAVGILYVIRSFVRPVA